ncbi:MAG TPA: MFS transporter [Solirubrobacteraceae bacterium]|nr:MFS transporter [Solirubrobacteraceae bacterium]
MDAGATRLDRLRASRAERPALAAFLGVFSATLLCFLAIGAVLPILPRYVTGELGAGTLAGGVVAGGFAISALIGRPIGGRPGARHGRKTIHATGLAICSLAGLLLFLPFGVAGLIFARLVVGLGDGWVFTAGVTWIVDLAPEERRGQTIGMFGLSIWGGLTFGSVIGEGMYALGGYEAVWAFAALAPLAGLLVARLVPEAPPTHQPVSEELAAAELGAAVVPAPGAPAPAPGHWIPREAVRPGVALALANIGFGTMAGFVVLLLAERGIGHGAAAFTVFSASVVVSRLFLGRLPDILGARRTALGAGLVQGLGLIAIGAAQSLPAALAAAAVMGMGMSLLFPSLALLVVDRVEPARRGAAMGAFTAFFDLGVGLGAPFAGLIASWAGSYPPAFYVGGSLCLMGALLGWFSTRGIRQGPVPA